MLFIRTVRSKFLNRTGHY